MHIGKTILGLSERAFGWSLALTLPPISFLSRRWLGMVDGECLPETFDV